MTAAFTHPGLYIEVSDAAAAAVFAMNLINASKWFDVTPLPDDRWGFTLKDEPGVYVFDDRSRTKRCWITDGQLTHRRDQD